MKSSSVPLPRVSEPWRRALAVLAPLLQAVSVWGYGSPNYNNMDTKQISFHLEYTNSIHTWATVKAVELLRADGWPGMADFAQAHLLPMLLGNAWNDHWGDRGVMTEGVLLDYFHPDPSDHNNGYGNPDADLFSGIDHSTDEFARCPFWGVENAGQHAELRFQAARRACRGQWGQDARDHLAGYVSAVRVGQTPFFEIHDPIHGNYTSQPNRLPWFHPGKAPAVISSLLARGCNTVVMFPQQTNPWLSTIHVPKPEQLRDRDDWFDLGNYRLRGYMGPDGGGKQAYVCFAGDNGLGLVFWVPPNSLEHAFFNLGWAMHLVQDNSLPMHTVDDAYDSFTAFRHNDYEDRWAYLLQRNWNTHIGGPLLKSALPASTLAALTSLYVFPPQRTSADGWAVNPAPHFKPRWYYQDLAPLLRPGEGVAHGYVRVSAEMAHAHLPYLLWTDDTPDDADAPYSLGFLLVWSTDLAIKTSAGLLRHFLTEVVKLREGVVYDGHGGPLLNTDAPYHLVGSLTVPAGKTLTIGPGVTVRFGSGHRLRADGLLRVNGGSASVRLTAEDDGLRGMRVSKDLILQNGGELRLP